MKKKLVSGMLTMSMCLGMMAGIPAMAASEEAAVDGAGETISVLCHSSWRTSEANEVFDYVADKCNVVFEFEEVPEGTAGEELIAAKIQSGEVPDILWWQGATTSINVLGDCFEELNRDDWTENYSDAVLDSYKQSYEGKMLCAPFGDVTVFGMVYNKQIFADNNLEIPTTWDELMEECETLKEKGYKPEDNHLKAGIFGAEPWTEEMRQNIQDLLGIRAYDIYGLTETSGPGVAFECCEQTGMHINEDHFIPEIIDPETGEVLPDGEKGELVFTSITKEAFPLLRYRTRDICVLSREKCSCGRTLIKMTKPMGRSDDMMIIRGVNVFPSQIETVLLNEGYSPNYQIEVDRVNNTDTLDVYVELSPEQFTDSLEEITKQEKHLVSAIRTMLGISPKVHLVDPKTIARSEGKAVRVIDKRKLHD